MKKNRNNPMLRRETIKMKAKPEADVGASALCPQMPKLIKFAA